MIIPIKIEMYLLYYYLLAGLVSVIKETIDYRKVDKRIDTVFVSIILTCFFLGFIILPVQMYNWIWEKWNKKV